VRLAADLREPGDGLSDGQASGHQLLAHLGGGIGLVQPEWAFIALDRRGPAGGEGEHDGGRQRADLDIGVAEVSSDEFHVGLGVGDGGASGDQRDTQVAQQPAGVVVGEVIHADTIATTSFPEPGAPNVPRARSHRPRACGGVVWPTA